MAGLSSLEPYVRSLMRIVCGFTFWLHGLQKLFGIFGGIGGGRVHYPALIWFAGCVESVGGILILLGLFTVPVAFLLSGEMAVGYFRGHFPRGFFPITNGGELAAVYCFVFLYLCVAGPGPLSVDRIVRKKG